MVVEGRGDGSWWRRWRLLGFQNPICRERMWEKLRKSKEIPNYMYICMCIHVERENRSKPRGWILKSISDRVRAWSYWKEGYNLGWETEVEGWVIRERQCVCVRRRERIEKVGERRKWRGRASGNDRISRGRSFTPKKFGFFGFIINLSLFLTVTKKYHDLLLFTTVIKLEFVTKYFGSPLLKLTIFVTV